MLKSYSAIYKQGYLEWLDDAPEQETYPLLLLLSKLTTKNLYPKHGVF
ncbi:MAG: hypothetical protein WCG16_07385 [Methylococcales bacterium]